MRYVKETLVTALIVLAAATALIVIGGQLATTEYASGTKTVDRFELGPTTHTEKGVRTTSKGCRIAWARRSVTFYGQEMGWSKLEVGWCYNGSTITDKNVNFYNRVTDWGNRLQWDLNEASKRCTWSGPNHHVLYCDSIARFTASVVYQVAQKYIELHVNVDRNGYSNVAGFSGGGGGGSW